MSLEEDALLDHRIDHLVHFIECSFENLGMDGIARQMRKHEVSDPFTPNRLLEIFSGMLAREREELINQAERNIQTAKQVRRSIAERFEFHREKGDLEIHALSAENLRLRREINQYESFIYDAGHKHRKIEARMARRADKLNQVQSEKYACFLELRQTSESLQDSLSEIAARIMEYQSEAADQLSIVRETVTSALRQVYEEGQLNDGLSGDREELSRQRDLSRYKAEAVHNFMAFVNSLERDDSVNLNISNLDSDVLDKCLESALRCAKSGLRTKDSRVVDPKSVVKFVNAELKERIQAKENYYAQILTKQRTSLERLAKELDSAQYRLNGLLLGDAEDEQRLLKLLDKSRRKMEATQERTDDIMARLQEQSYSSVGSFD